MSSLFHCLDCGHCHPKKVEACVECQGPRVVAKATALGRPAHKPPARPSVLDESVSVPSIKGADPPRYQIALVEVNRVFGGGIVNGSSILLTGHPGIGKSTLLLQIAAETALAYPGHECAALYCTGEEDNVAIGTRARRLGKSVPGMRVLEGQSIQKVEASIKARKPKLVILDSVGTFFDAEAKGVEGSIQQILSVLSRLRPLCKKIGATLIIVVHVTKDGIAGGPKRLEHMVDAFVEFGGERTSPLRTLTVIKNRFGRGGEQAILEMCEEGLREVPDAMAQMLADRAVGEPGAVIFASAESDRASLIELEALVAEPEKDEEGNTPTRAPSILSAVGLTKDRASRLLGQLNGLVDLNARGLNIEVNSLTGGTFAEPAMDLAIAAAVVSSRERVALPPDVVVLGQVSVTGRVKAVTRCKARLEEALRHGFTRAVLPAENVRLGEVPAGITAVGVSHLRDLANWVRFGSQAPARPPAEAPAQAA